MFKVNNQKFIYIEIFKNVRVQSVAAAPEKENQFDFINSLKRPRFIKSHLPITFLPRELWKVKPKITFVAREAKDAAVSFFHHYYNLYQYQGTKEEYLDLFLKGESKKIFETCKYI